MNNKKYKATMGVIAGLTVITGGLFAYDNIYLEKQKEADLTTIYLAKNDIQAHTKITPEMFDGVKVQSNSVIPNTVINLEGVKGYELKGGLLKGETLSAQRLENADTKKDGNLLLEIIPDFVGDVAVQDNIKVYVQMSNRDTGEVTVKELFKEKKIVPSGEQGLIEGVSTTSTTNSNEPVGYHVNASEEEVENYYIAKATGQLIVIKIEDVDTNSISSKEIKPFDKNDEDVKNASKESATSNEGLAVMTYTVESGDTLDTLALKFKTKNETISGLNEGKTTFKAGEMIQVPAN